MRDTPSLNEAHQRLSGRHGRERESLRHLASRKGRRLAQEAKRAQLPTGHERKKFGHAHTVRERFVICPLDAQPIGVQYVVHGQHDGGAGESGLGGESEATPKFREESAGAVVTTQGKGDDMSKNEAGRLVVNDVWAERTVRFERIAAKLRNCTKCGGIKGAMTPAEPTLYGFGSPAPCVCVSPRKNWAKRVAGVIHRLTKPDCRKCGGEDFMHALSCTRRSFLSTRIAFGNAVIRAAERVQAQRALREMMATLSADVAARGLVFVGGKWVMP